MIRPRGPALPSVLILAMGLCLYGCEPDSVTTSDAVMLGLDLAQVTTSATAAARGLPEARAELEILQTSLSDADQATVEGYRQTLRQYLDAWRAIEGRQDGGEVLVALDRITHWYRDARDHYMALRALLTSRVAATEAPALRRLDRDLHRLDQSLTALLANPSADLAARVVGELLAVGALLAGEG